VNRTPTRNEASNDSVGIQGIQVATAKTKIIMEATVARFANREPSAKKKVQ
jgi:hypothetical protein